MINKHDGCSHDNDKTSFDSQGLTMNLESRPTYNYNVTSENTHQMHFYENKNTNTCVVVY